MTIEVQTENLRRYVDELAALPRPAGSAALATARSFVQNVLQAHGWQVTPTPFRAEDENGTSWNGVNLVARLPRWHTNRLPRFCVGAHLDSVPQSPGADDNASAVAALLEIARLLPAADVSPRQAEPELVVFDLEEHGMLGGAEQARRTKAAGVNLLGMVSLEMLGYCDPAAGAQSLPRSLVGQYPDTGDFIAVIGNQNSGPLIERFSEGMRQVPGLPVETLMVPENGLLLQATRLSDHSPFWDAGYPALMITDTSFLRNPHYHLPSDTPETLDWDFLTRVAEGCFRAVIAVLRDGI